MSSSKKDFEKIYDTYVERIYRFVFIKVNSTEIAEDLTSETFLRTWQKYKNKDNKIENIQAFLYQTARNLVIDYYRDKGRAQLISLDYVPLSDNNNVEEIVQKKSDLAKIKSALSKLNDDYQNIIIWHYIDDLSIEEISKMLNKSQGAVRVTLHRAIKSLKNIMNEEIERNIS
jgi:RNA polymerase sigma-70 factor (ECF subfamily)